MSKEDISLCTHFLHSSLERHTNPFEMFCTINTGLVMEKEGLHVIIHTSITHPKNKSHTGTSLTISPLQVAGNLSNFSPWILPLFSESRVSSVASSENDLGKIMVWWHWTHLKKPQLQSPHQGLQYDSGCPLTISDSWNVCIFSQKFLIFSTYV